MKFYTLAILILFTAITGCDNNKKNNTAPPPPPPGFGSQIELAGNLKELPSDTYEEYNFKPGRHQNNNCETDWRISLNIEQYCFQLQSDWANNSCAVRRRRQAFESDCSGKVWDPDEAERGQQMLPGPHITCYVSDPSEDGLEDKKRNPDLYENDEHFTDSISAIRYKDNLAFIFMDLKDGLFRVKIRAFDTGSGRLLGEKEMTWKDQMPKEVMLENLTERVRVICTPSIR